MNAPRMPYGLLAEFENPEDLLVACEAARAAGYTRLEAFTPFPLQALEPILGLGDRRVYAWGIVGGLLGATCGFVLQAFASLDYPLDIGGRPVIAPTALMVVTFLLAVLFAAVGAVLGFFVLCRLPRLHHPVFEASAFGGAADDRFFLCLLAEDPAFDLAAGQAWLADRALSVTELWQ